MSRLLEAKKNDCLSSAQPANMARAPASGVRSRMEPSGSRRYRWSISSPLLSIWKRRRSSFGKYDTAKTEELSEAVRGVQLPSEVLTVYRL